MYVPASESLFRDWYKCMMERWACKFLKQQVYFDNLIRIEQLWNVAAEKLISSSRDETLCWRLSVAVCTWKSVSCDKPCLVMRDMRHTARDSDNDIIRYTRIFCLCSVSRDKRQVTRVVSAATCSERWRDFLEVTWHCDIICTKYRALIWILRCPSLRNAIIGWTVHDLFFKRFSKCWRLIQQGDTYVPCVCLYWCREWNLHRSFCFWLVCNLNRTPIVLAKRGGSCVYFSGIWYKNLV